MKRPGHLFWSIGTLFIVLLCLPYYLLCQYIWPAGDDYSYAVHGLMSQNYFRNVISDYFTWNGRYLSNFLVMANPIGIGAFWLYRLTPILLMTLHFFVFYNVLKKLVNKIPQIAQPIGTKELRFLVVLFELTYLSTMPDISEGLYWYTATVTYLLPLTITPLLIYLVISLYSEPKRQTKSVVACVALMVLINGCNEMMMLLLSLGFLSLYVLALLRKHKNTRTFLILLLFQFFFATVVYFAPGNEIRSSFFENKHDLVHTIVNGSMNTGRFTIWFFLHPFVITSLLFLIRFKPAVNTKNILPPRVWALIFIIPLFISCAAPVWTTGIIGQHRTVNVAYYFMVMTVFSYCLIGHNVLVDKIRFQLLRIKPVVFLCILCASFLVSGNLKLCLSDLINGKAKAFFMENKQRETLVINSHVKEGGFISVPFLSNKPQSVYHTNYDVGTNSDHWVNDAISRFYGLKSKGVGIKGYTPY